MHGIASAAFGVLGTADLKAALKSKAITVAASILPTSGQELLHPLHKLRSEELKPITTPDPLSIVVYVAIGLLGMANPLTVCRLLKVLFIARSIPLEHFSPQ